MQAKTKYVMNTQKGVNHVGIWARRVVEIQMADPSFKFEDESDLLDFLNNEIDVYDNLHNGGGMIDVPLSILRKAVRMAGELHLSEKTIKCLKQDIRTARLNKDESVSYSCF